MLKGKVAIVTGAGSGIGRGIALRFAKEGADIVIPDLNLEGAQNTAKEIEALGRNSLVIKMDVSNSSDVDRMVTETINNFGKIDILVNNAGIFIQKPLLETTEADWDKVLDINLKGAFLCSKRVVKEMLKRGGGKIINLASVAGQVGFANSSAYCASKGGVINLTREMALELAPKNINVNAIGPGSIETPMTREMLADPAIKQMLLGVTPFGRIGQPEDIANAASFLASGESNFVNGITLFVDGGWLTQ
ncbi:MAG: 3-oxoacyl-ACP reductase FabG [Methanocellales archaeon]|nr:3-oxoacyl-ACP reductase FabG [Methanocellales archaeon]